MLGATLETAKRRLSDAKYWLLYRFHPRHRYHLVDTGLGYGYHDCDERILHACMALLSSHVEEEHGGAEKLAEFSTDLREHPDHNAPEGFNSGQAERQDEAVAIYRWWKQERPADQKRRLELLRKCYVRKEGTKEDHDEFQRVDAKIDTDEESMLLRLMAIRRSLWT